MKAALLPAMLLIAVLLATACGDDPLGHQRRKDDHMMNYLIRTGRVTTVSATTTQTSTTTVTVSATK